MTLIVGYIYSDSVQIIADSAVTFLNSTHFKSVDDKLEYNSLGEIIELNDETLVKESANKIYVLNDSLLIAFSGLESEGILLIEDLNIFLSALSTKVTSKNLNTFFQLNAPKNTSYLIGFCQDNRPTLFSYNGKVEILSKKGEFLIIGSGASEELLTMPFKIAFEQLSKRNIETSLFLIFINSLLQCSALNSQSFSRGVGGFFNGAQIKKDGVSWVRDTCSILYSSVNFEKSERFIINKYNRDNAVFLSSPKIDKAVYFTTSNLLSISIDHWLKKWEIELTGLNAACSCDYYVYICYDRRIISIVNTANDRYKKLMKIHKINESEIGFELHIDLINKLLTYAVNPETGEEDIEGFGFQINYL